MDVVIAGAGAGLAVVETWNGNEILSGIGWTAVGVAIAKSALTAGLSYIARLKVPPRP